MFKARLLRILILAILGLHSGQALAQPQIKYPALTARGFNQLKNFYQSILEGCGPPDCLQVYLGRSSALASAYGESLGFGASQISLPLSGVKLVSSENLGLLSTRFKNEVLDVFLKPILLTIPKYKRIAVIDFVNGGNTLAQGSLMMKQWLTEQQMSGVEVEAFAYGGILKLEAETILKDSQIPIRRLSFPIGTGIDGDLSELVYNAKTEGYAAYGKWSPIENVNSPEINRDIRQPYNYRDVQGSTHYASYNEVVEWMKNPKLTKDCNEVFHYPNFNN